MIQYIPLLGELLKRLFPDPSERIKYETQISTEISKMIEAEAKSESWLTRNWRPWLMFSTGNLVVIWGINNFVIRPWVIWAGGTMPLMEIPPEFWHLITLGFGVYGGARTLEKVVISVLDTIKRR